MNWDGIGGTFVTIVTASDPSGGAGNFTTADVLPGNISGKAVHIGYFNRQVFPESAGTCVASDDGTEIYLSNPEYFTAEQTIYIGAIGRRDPIGVRKIVTLVDGTATLDRAIVWRHPPTATVTYADFGDTNGIPRPSLPVSFKFPLRGYLNGGSFIGPSATVTRNTAGSDSIGSEVAFGAALITNQPGRLASDGTTVSAGTIKHELGYVDCGFLVADGDELSVTAGAYVDDYAPIFEGDPMLSGRADLARGSVLAELGIGAKT